MAKDEINVPIALGAFRDKGNKRSKSKREILILWLLLLNDFMPILQVGSVNDDLLGSTIARV